MGSLAHVVSAEIPLCGGYSGGGVAQCTIRQRHLVNVTLQYLYPTLNACVSGISNSLHDATPPHTATDTDRISSY